MLFFFAVDGAWFIGSLRVRSSSINHTWLSLSKGELSPLVNSDEQLFISLAVLLDLLHFFSCICQMWGNAASLYSLAEPHWQHIIALLSKYKWTSRDGLTFKWKLLQWKKCILLDSVVTSSEKKEKTTPRNKVSSYFWAQHSRGLWHVEQSGGKAQASQCMRKLITRREEADAVYLGFLHGYNCQALRLLNYAALQIAWNDPGYFVPLEGRRWEVLWLPVVVGSELYSASQVWPLSYGEVCQETNADGF